ncbi:translation machinery-associated protein 16 [Apiosordaria backusii]|uniref:Translation machinery-associated protein 16 n=1 Tax=Apiosordaria backusii TaxID=314023 RepID=A0AA40DZH9_9PEZI|nr:translation machinery-associated protein 16 [Apiosordaria backusii]
MAKTFEKERKRIAKKRNGTIDALHANSRNAKRLHKAVIRDDRLGKLAAARKKQDKPLIHRTRFFLAAARENELKPLEPAAIQALIQEFVQQHNEEYEEIKKTRRSGRPPSTREDLLKMAIAALEMEHKNGFYLPDLTSEKNLELLERWDGSNWAFLTNVTWVKISADGTTKPSSFPPQGL